ncbi:MAG TPA: tetratricopeptide repeat protein [Candidatus Polarisedimenticolia bacterium]|nr:tetratricopeptide repeat protein [Candidatus Polarisedimenticolia bacterium]
MARARALRGGVLATSLVTGTLAAAGPPPESPDARIYFAAPAPAPLVTYEDSQGHPRTAPSAGPLLVVLRSVRCTGCDEDIKALHQRREAIEQAQLEVLLLDAGPLIGLPAAGPPPGGFPFPWGTATARLAQGLDVLRSQVIRHPGPITVPSSFLLDADGLVAALFKGPLPLDDLLRDLPGLRAAGEKRLSPALPSSGRGKGSFAESMDGIAVAYQEAGLLDETIAYHRKVLRIKPGRMASLVPLAGALAARGDLEEAETAYRRALAIEPGHVIALVNLGLVLSRMGREDEAVESLSEAVRISPDHQQARYHLGLALARRGQTDRAAQQLAEAMGLPPGSAVAQERMAWFFATHPDPVVRHGAQAVKLAEQLVRMSGETAGHLDTLAAAYAEAGRFDEAVAAAQRAVALAAEAGDTRHAEAVRSRLKLYEQGRPFHETPRSSP